MLPLIKEEIKKEKSTIQARYDGGIENTVENHSFLSIVSHNIKNPFSTLLGFSELLSTDFSELTNSEKEFYIDEINKSAKMSFKYFERFFEWIYYKTGKINLHSKTIFLINIVNNVISDLPDELALKCKINLRFDRDISLYADYESVNKIIYYLLENAIKYSDDHSNVTIQADTSLDQIIINVIDEGIGIKETDISKLFNMVEDPSLISTFVEKGTGMGLILAKLFTESNGGEISVRSSVGKGSTFAIKLPKYKQ